MDFQDVEDASFLFFQLHQDNKENNILSVDIAQVLGVKHNQTMTLYIVNGVIESSYEMALSLKMSK